MLGVGPLTGEAEDDDPPSRAEKSRIGGAFTTRELGIDAGERQSNDLTRVKTGVNRMRGDEGNGIMTMFTTRRG